MSEPEDRLKELEDKEIAINLEIKRTISRKKITQLYKELYRISKELETVEKEVERKFMKILFNDHDTTESDSE